MSNQCRDKMKLQARESWPRRAEQRQDRPGRDPWSKTQTALVIHDTAAVLFRRKRDCRPRGKARDQAVDANWRHHMQFSVASIKHSTHTSSESVTLKHIRPGTSRSPLEYRSRREVPEQQYIGAGSQLSAGELRSPEAVPVPA